MFPTEEGASVDGLSSQCVARLKRVVANLNNADASCSICAQELIERKEGNAECARLNALTRKEVLTLLGLLEKMLEAQSTPDDLPEEES